MQSDKWISPTNPSFHNLYSFHILLYTCSSLSYAISLSEEKSSHVIKSAMLVIGVPLDLKSNNGFA